MTLDLQEIVTANVFQINDCISLTKELGQDMPFDFAREAEKQEVHALEWTETQMVREAGVELELAVVREAESAERTLGGSPSPNCLPARRDPESGADEEAWLRRKRAKEGPMEEHCRVGRSGQGVGRFDRSRRNYFVSKGLTITSFTTP